MAEFLHRLKMPVQKVGAVGYVDSVRLDRQRRGMTGQLDGFQQLRGALGKAGGHIGADHAVDLPA